MKQQKKKSLKHHVVASTTSNKHLEGWLKLPKPAFNPSDDPSDSLDNSTITTTTTSSIDTFERADKKNKNRNKNDHTEPTIALDQTPPRVLITTSLLSRGLDFSPSIKHVILVDQAHDQVDFLHRAGRTGRGESGVGNVYVFDTGDVMRRGGKERNWSGGRSQQKVVRVEEGRRGTVPGWVGTMIRRKGERREEEERRDPAAKARRRQDNEKVPMKMTRNLKDVGKEKQGERQQLRRERVGKKLVRRG